MKNINGLCLTILLVITGLLMGCNDSSNNSANDAGVNVSGHWTLNAENQTSTMILNQNGDNLTGSVQGVPLTGSVSGNNISITTGYSGGPLLVAEGSVDGNTMGGSYTATAPNTAEHTGTWSAVKQ